MYYCKRLTKHFLFGTKESIKAITAQLYTTPKVIETIQNIDYKGLVPNYLSEIKQ